MEEKGIWFEDGKEESTSVANGWSGRVSKREEFGDEGSATTRAADDNPRMDLLKKFKTWASLENCVVARWMRGCRRLMKLFGFHGNLPWKTENGSNGGKVLTFIKAKLQLWKQVKRIVLLITRQKCKAVNYFPFSLSFSSSFFPDGDSENCLSSVNFITFVSKNC